MIASPMNDHGCLGPTTDQIRAELADGNPAIVELAERFANTIDLAAWFRTLPQRDDDGIPDDGPKVDACRPAQRLRLDADDPNCFERSARFIGAAELIDPDRVYRLATISTPNGLHTFPTQDGEPVVLDPTGVRNTPRVLPSTTDTATRRLRIQRLLGTDETKGARGDLARALRAKELGHTTWVQGEPIDDAIATYEQTIARYHAILDELDDEDDAEPARNSRCARPMVLTPTQAVDWISDLARARVEPMPGMLPHVNRGHRAMREVLLMVPICVADAQSVALVLALAEREARVQGMPAVKVVHSTARAIDTIDRLAAERASTPPARNINPFASLALGVLNNKDLQSWLGAVTRVGGRILGGAGVQVLKSQLASVGVSQPVLSAFEKELNREGLTLGPLSRPSPMPGSLDAMTPQALAGRWIAQKL